MSQIDAEKIGLDIKRAFLLAKALNFQFIHIRDHVNPEMKKIINEAKSRNSYFIKKIEEKFEKKKIKKSFVQGEEEFSFLILEEMEKLGDKIQLSDLENILNEIKDVNQQNLHSS